MENVSENGLIHGSSGFPNGASGKEPTCNAGDIRDAGFPGSGRSPGGGNGNPLWYSCLENPMDRGGYSVWEWQNKTEATSQAHKHIKVDHIRWD